MQTESWILLMLAVNLGLSGAALAVALRARSAPVPAAEDDTFRPGDLVSGRGIDVAVLLKKLEWYYLETHRFVDAMDRAPSDEVTAFDFDPEILRRGGLSDYENQILATMGTRHELSPGVRMEELADSLPRFFNPEHQGQPHPSSETVDEQSFYSRVRKLRGMLKFAIYFLKKEFRQLEGRDIRSDVQV